MVSQAVLVVKNLPANAGDTRDTVSTPGLGRSPGVGNGNPLQYACLGNHMDRGAWQATVHGSQRLGYECKKDNKYQIPYDIFHRVRTTDPYIMRKHT